MNLILSWPPQTDETNADLNPFYFGMMTSSQVGFRGKPFLISNWPITQHVCLGLGGRLYKADSVLHSESKDVSNSEEQQLEAAVAMSKTTLIGSRQKGGQMYGRSHRKPGVLSKVSNKNVIRISSPI